MSLIPDKHQITRSSSSEDETYELGAELAKEVAAKTSELSPMVISLAGPLGAGKTAFARGFISAWTNIFASIKTPSVISPTFNIARIYAQDSKKPIAHLDLYRIKSLNEAEELGFDHYANEYSVCLVEWLEQIPELRSRIPKSSIEISIEIVPQSLTRSLNIEKIFRQN